MDPSQHPIPEATIARLPGYLRVLTALDDHQVAVVSSTELAERAGVQSALLRRDLSHFGSYGTRGVGYEVPVLIREIGEHVGTGTTWPVIVIGVGNMGRALALHIELLDRDFHVVALLDVDPSVVGTTVAGVLVDDQSQLEHIVRTRRPRIAILTTPPSAAQGIVDRLLEAGVTSVLNFAPTTLAVPEGATIRGVDLAQELRILAFHEARRQGEPATHEDIEEFAT